MRFHVPGLAHTISTPEYSSCAFTAKVVKLCKMLKHLGHEVIHYGHEASEVQCDEHVPVTDYADLVESYGKHDWRREGWPKFDAVNDLIYKKFNAKTIEAIGKRKSQNDFLLCSFGFGHKPLADAHLDMIIVEPGIGYPSGAFAPFRIFESYAVMHAYQGQHAVASGSNNFWYDAVIPNYFDVEEFHFSENKGDYFLFLGRVNCGKGIHIAQQMALDHGKRLVVAGVGDFVFDKSPLIECVGLVNPSQRKTLLSQAQATLCPSTFLEPFCGVQVESFLSGTPVISTDRGAFAEYNIHGITGYRCRTMDHFRWAAQNIDELSPTNCRSHGLNFSLENVAGFFNEYFQSVLDLRTGKGWYEPRQRTNLNATAFEVKYG